MRFFRRKPGDKQPLDNANRPKWFISHKYGDSAVPEMLAHIPQGIEPVIFPPIRVPPEKLISNDLIEAILACDGLIYPTGSGSDDSPWVVLERDYALRAGKQVFAYDAATQRIERDASAPMHLPVFPSYAHVDDEHVKTILRFMREERFFDVWIDTDDVMPGVNFQEALQNALVKRLEAGGYAVVFLSRQAITSHWVRLEYSSALRQFPEQVLPALLEPGALPLDLLDILALQLYGDEVRSATHRMDDLIVSLYWLIYRHQRQGDTEIATEQ